MFDRLVWREDRMLLDDLVFRLEHHRSDRWELGQECFGFYKIKPLVDQYARFWSRLARFRARNVLELGIWDGGSVAFWFESLGPEKHVGIDNQERTDSDYFRHYVASRGLKERIRTYWQTDQADRPRLREIVADEFGGPLDLVIDDASHMYGPTRASFEALFPLLRPGGLYIVEDWAWAHWREFQALDHPWANETALTQLVVEFVELAGSSTELIGGVTVFQGFVAVERGEAQIEDHTFDIESYISRRPPPARSPLPHWIPRLSGKRLLGV
jgi:hypothetical protein